MDDNEKLCCGNCKYAAYSRENGYVCENMNSDYASDYVEHDHGCEEWRSRDDQFYDSIHYRCLFWIHGGSFVFEHSVRRKTS